MSEAELHVPRARLRGGILHKARRGELHCHLLVDFVYTSDGRVALDPDTQVQESVRLFFQTFLRTGAAHATVKYFHEQRLLALLVEDVTLLKQRQVTDHVRFRGGATTTAQVAAILNERGLRTDAGEALDPVRLQWVRASAGFTSLMERPIAAGMLTGTQIAAQPGVRRTTIGRWRREGRLEARICDEMGQWLHAPQQAVRPTAGLQANTLRRVPRTTPL